MGTQALASLYQNIRFRNYKIAYSGSMSLNFATLLFFIKQLHILSLLDTTNSTWLQSDIYSNSQFLKTVFLCCRFSTLSIDNLSLSSQLYLYIGILVCQLLMILTLIIRTDRKSINSIFSKFLTITNIVLPIPITLNLTKLIGTDQMSNKSIILSIAILTFLLMLINYTVYVNFHFVFSIKHIANNCLARFANYWVKEYSWVLVSFVYSILIKYGSFSLFVIYLIAYFFLACFDAKKYAIGTEFLDSRMNRNIGIFCLLTITISIAVLSCFLQFKLFQNSLTAFIWAFYLFFINFFTTFRKFWLKRIIIDDNTTSQPSQITYVTTFIIFSIDNSQKKNQTYISSLLKNHCNNCNDLSCCCKNRDTIYDPLTRHTGNKKLQPHLDLVFVKHFYHKMIQDSIQEFPKSFLLKMLQGIYCLEFMELSPECVKLIKFFNKKFIFDKLSLQEKFALFCLQEQFISFVTQNNKKKGDQNIEKAKKFDQYFNQLVQKILKTTQSLKYFWQYLNNLSNAQHKQITPQFLNQISTKTLKLMEQIQYIYDRMKEINPASMQLREIMFFYSKEVISDMDFFIRLKEDLKISSISRRHNSDKKELKELLNIYSNQSSNLVVSNINKILWVSNNCQMLFGYKKLIKLQKSTVNDLMPPIFGKTHDSLVNKWLQTGFCRKMNTTNLIWCRKENGACFRALIYMKVMVNFENPVDKDIHYYVSIESIDTNDIICGQDGEIFGCDQNLKLLMKTRMKVIQSIRPNIQIFFPSLFQYFFNYFYDETIEIKKKIQQKCSGYIPGKLIDYIQNFGKQRQYFINKNKKNQSFQQMYGIFLQMKMQQITMNMKGRYLTVDFQIERMNMLGRELVVLKMHSIQGNTVEKYYNQFQKTLKQILMIKEKWEVKRENSFVISNNRGQQNHPSLKPFQFFLNPKKLKKLQLHPDNILTQPQHQGKPKNSLNHRKQRAINQLVTIKNTRVKQNISKLKQALLDNKILSPNVYRILTEQKDDDMYVVQEQEEEDNQQVLQIQKTGEFVHVKSKINILNQDNLSSDNMVEDSNEGSFDKYIEKDKDAVSFQESTASSAAFISLSTKIKLLKEKLRQTRSHPFIVVVNVLFILLIGCTLLVNTYEIVMQMHNIDEQAQQNRQFMSTYRLFDSLISAKLELNQKQIYLSSEDTQFYRLYNIFKQIVHQQLQFNLKNGNKIQNYEIQVSPSMPSTGINQTQMWFSIDDFVLREYQSLIKEQSTWKAIQYYYIFEKVVSKIEQKLNKQYRFSYLVYLLGGYLLIQLLVAVNLWISNKKIYMITKLMSQLYPHQKQKYLKIFVKLSIKMNMLLKQKNLVQTNPNKHKRNPHNNITEAQTNTNKSAIDAKQSKTLAKNVLVLLVVIFGLVYASVGCMLAVEKVNTDQVRLKNYQYDSVVIKKLQLNFKFLCMQNIKQDRDCTGADYKNQQLQIIPLIIQLYNSQGTRTNIKQVIQKYSTNNICQTLQVNNPIQSNKQSLLANISQTCSSTNNQIYKTGLLNGYSYIQQQLSYYQQNDPKAWPQQSITNTMQTNIFASLISMNLFAQFLQQKNGLQRSLLVLKIVLFGCLSFVLVVVVIVWRKAYQYISRLGSMHNRYLLMIPFDLLIENPYLRQYLKEELMFKNNIY